MANEFILTDGDGNIMTVESDGASVLFAIEDYGRVLTCEVTSDQLSGLIAFLQKELE